MSKRRSVEHILDTMHEMYRDFPITELQYDTPWQCLIAVMMSAQTTDIQVNKVTDILYQKIKSPADVLEMWERELGEHIRTLGLRTAKQKNVYKTAQLLVAESERRSEEKGRRNEEWGKKKSPLRSPLGGGEREECGKKKSPPTPTPEHPLFLLRQNSPCLWERGEHDVCHAERNEVESKYATQDDSNLYPATSSGWKTHEPNKNESQRQGQEKADRLVCRDSAEVLERYGYRLPDTLEGMMELPGVGVKTAKVVLYVLYRQRRVAVDTHVHRVMNRLWVITTTTPDQSSTQLETIIPDEYKDIAHHSIIYFGRYHCKAKKPNCGACVLRNKCRWYEENGE